MRLIKGWGWGRWLGRSSNATLEEPTQDADRGEGGAPRMVELRNTEVREPLVRPRWAGVAPGAFWPPAGRARYFRRRRSRPAGSRLPSGKSVRVA